MTDYLEEVLEEETEDMETFRPRRAAVRDPGNGQTDAGEENGKMDHGGAEDNFPTAGVLSDPAGSVPAERREKTADPAKSRTGKGTDGAKEAFPVRAGLPEDGTEEERALPPVFRMRRRAAVPAKEGKLQEKREKEADSEPERSGEEETRGKRERSGEEEDGDVPPELVTKQRAVSLRAVGMGQGREDQGTVLQLGATDLPEGFASVESEAAVPEELAEAERMAHYAGAGESFSSAVRDGTLSAWEESGREEAAGFLLRAIARAGRASRIVREGTGTAVVTLPGEGPSAPEPDVEALDRLVRQDARRYDGGFQLF